MDKSNSPLHAADKQLRQQIKQRAKPLGRWPFAGSGAVSDSDSASGAGAQNRINSLVLAERAVGFAVPLAAVLLALLIGMFMLLALGKNPIEGYEALFVGAFGSQDALADTAVKATPLLLVGAGICIAFRASVINIGGEGQILIGALLCTVTALELPESLPRWLLLILTLLAGAVGGAIWGWIPGVLKAYASVNEILSSIMLNIVAGFLVQYLVLGPLIDTEGQTANIAQTARLPEKTDLPILLGDSNLHMGILVGIAMAIVAFVLLWLTSYGFDLRAVGHNQHASRYAGIRVKQNIVAAMTLSGMMSGIAGAVLVLASISHRLNLESGAGGFTQLAGFNGIVAALFGGLHPIFTIPASFLFGGLLTGANAMQRAIQVETPMVVALSGLVVVFVVSSESLVGKLRQRIKSAIEKSQSELTDPPSDPMPDDTAHDAEPSPNPTPDPPVR